MRTLLIRVITFLGGVYFFLEYVLPREIAGYQFSRYSEEITVGIIAVTVMAVGLGIVNLLWYHGAKIIFKRSGWIYSAALLLSLAAMLAVSMTDWRASARYSAETQKLTLLHDFSRKIESDLKSGAKAPPLDFRILKLKASLDQALAEIRAEALKIMLQPRAQMLLPDLEAALNDINKAAADISAAEPKERISAALLNLAEKIRVAGSLYSEIGNIGFESSSAHNAYKLLFDGLYNALGAAMFSLLAFYIAAAAYRAFRVRSMESGTLMLAALLVMLGQIPFGVWLWEGLPEVRLWLLQNPSAAAFRAIKIGAAIAGLVMALRMWLSIESGSFAERSK